MLKIKILAITFILILSACTNVSKESHQIKGIDGSPIPPAFAQFPDIPFPEDSYINLEQTKALGSGENWIGSLDFTVPFDASSVYDFYVAEMPKMNWTEIAMVRAKISNMTYMRNNRAVQILIERRGSDAANVTITAIPNQASHAGGK